MSYIKASIIIPCYNEEKFIHQTISSILKQDNIFEIIIVDDCSEDNSLKIAESIINNKIKIIKNDKNMGKGFCLQKGFKEASGDVVIIQDADLEYSPSDIKYLLLPFQELNADFVIGTRFQTKKNRKIGYFYHTIFNKFITFLVNFKSNKNFTDIECGYKAIKTEHLKKVKLFEIKFGIEVELVLKLSKLSLNIHEVAVSYNMRGYDEGKKIGIKDAFSAIYCLLKY